MLYLMRSRRRLCYVRENFREIFRETFWKKIGVEFRAFVDETKQIQFMWKWSQKFGGKKDIIGIGRNIWSIESITNPTRVPNDQKNEKISQNLRRTSITIDLFTFLTIANIFVRSVPRHSLTINMVLSIALWSQRLLDSFLWIIKIGNYSGLFSQFVVFRHSVSIYLPTFS